MRKNRHRVTIGFIVLFLLCLVSAVHYWVNRTEYEVHYIPLNMHFYDRLVLEENIEDSAYFNFTLSSCSLDALFHAIESSEPLGPRNVGTYLLVNSPAPVYGDIRVKLSRVGVNGVIYITTNRGAIFRSNYYQPSSEIVNNATDEIQTEARRYLKRIQLPEHLWILGGFRDGE